MNKNKVDFYWVLIAKGIGIILVVIYHFYTNDTPDYWNNLINIISYFHMPLFFLLSGFLYSYEKQSYSTLIKIKTKRLLYPFISIAVIFFIIKYPAGIIFDLEYPVGLESFYTLLVNPANSYKPLLWFLHALFLIFLIYPLTRNIINNNFFILTMFILLYIFWGENYPVIGPALVHIPYFIVGVILRESIRFRDRIIWGTWIHAGVSLIIFILMILAETEAMNQSGYISRGFRLMLGISGSICVINISLLIDNKRKAGVERMLLAEIGFYSMSIYLFHTFFQSVIRIGFNQVLTDFPVCFEVIALIAVIAGILCPLFIEKKLLRKNKITRKYILGLK